MLKTSAPTTLDANAVLEEIKKDPKEEWKNIACQICNRKGHGVLNCYNRLDIVKFFGS